MFVRIVLEVDSIGLNCLTNDFSRADSSGWYVRASSDRGRSLSTSKAILPIECVVLWFEASRSLFRSMLSLQSR